VVTYFFQRASTVEDQHDAGTHLTPKHLKLINRKSTVHYSNFQNTFLSFKHFQYDFSFFLIHCDTLL